MKALLLFCSVLLLSTISISFTNNHKPELSRDQAFIASVQEMSRLASSSNTKTEAEINETVRKIASSIAVLQTKYPELLNASTSSEAWRKAVDKLATDQQLAINCDTCLRDFVKAVFSCFCSSGPRATVNACLPTACANYQSCKAGENR